MVPPGKAAKGSVDFRRVGRGSDLQYRVVVELGADDWQQNRAGDYRRGA
jgi:hypothetical protein